MRLNKTIKAEDLQIGDYLPNEDKFVEEIRYVVTHMIVKCAYEKGYYHGTSLLLDYNESVCIAERE
jgi:hypothetical protein